MNNKELLTGIFAFFGTVIITIFGILILLFYNSDYLLIYFLMVFSFLLLFYLVLYLKIQHNFERNMGLMVKANNQLVEKLFKGLEEKFSCLDNCLEEKFSCLDNCLEEQDKRIYVYLEEGRRDLKEKFEEQKDIQKKMAAGVEDLFNTHYEQVSNLEKKWDEIIKKSKKSNKSKK